MNDIMGKNNMKNDYLLPSGYGIYPRYDEKLSLTLYDVHYPSFTSNDINIKTLPSYNEAIYFVYDHKRVEELINIQKKVNLMFTIGGVLIGLFVFAIIFLIAFSS